MMNLNSNYNYNYNNDNDMQNIQTTAITQSEECKIDDKQKQNKMQFPSSNKQMLSKHEESEQKMKFLARLQVRRNSIYQIGDSKEQDVLGLLGQHRQMQSHKNNNYSPQHLSSDTNQPLTPEQVVTFLQLPHYQRRTSDLRSFRLYFLQFHFFQTLMQLEGQDFVHSCIDNLTYKPFKSHSLLFNSSLGEIEPDVRGVMILLQGKSRIFYNRECGLKYSFGQSCNYEENSKIIGDGYTLGAYEYELDSVRQTLKKVYSIICDSFCQFAFLDKQIYSHLKLQKVRYEKRDQIEFFKTIQIFKNFEEMTLVEMILQCESQTYSRMQYVYKEGDDSDYVYIVHSGEFRLQMKKQSMSQSTQRVQDANKYSLKNSSEESQVNCAADSWQNNKQISKNEQEGQFKIFKSITSVEQNNSNFHNQKLNDLYCLMKKNRKTSKDMQEEITMIIYDQGTLFGDSEILEEMQSTESSNGHCQHKKRKREYSVQCMSNQGHCFKISNFKFRKLLNTHKQIGRTLVDAKQSMDTWLQWRCYQVVNSQLLNHAQFSDSKASKIISKTSSSTTHNKQHDEQQQQQQQQQQQMKSKLIEQHKSATKYLEHSLELLQYRLQRDQKNRIQKTFHLEKELKNLRDNRQQLLHNQLTVKEKNKPEDIIIQQSPTHKNNKNNNLILTSNNYMSSFLNQNMFLDLSNFKGEENKNNIKQNVSFNCEKRSQNGLNGSMNRQNRSITQENRRENGSVTIQDEKYPKESSNEEKNKIRERKRLSPAQRVRELKLNLAQVQLTQEQYYVSPKNNARSYAGSTSPWKKKEVLMPERSEQEYQQNSTQCMYNENEESKKRLLKISQCMREKGGEKQRKRECNMYEYPWFNTSSPNTRDSPSKLVYHRDSASKLANQSTSCQTINFNQTDITVDTDSQQQSNDQGQKEDMNRSAFSRLNMNSLHQDEQKQKLSFKIDKTVHSSSSIHLNRMIASQINRMNAIQQNQLITSPTNSMCKYNNSQYKQKDSNYQEEQNLILAAFPLNCQKISFKKVNQNLENKLRSNSHFEQRMSRVISGDNDEKKWHQDINITKDISNLNQTLPSDIHGNITIIIENAIKDNKQSINLQNHFRIENTTKAEHSNKLEQSISLKQQNLPLKYFIPKYRVTQKQHRKIVIHRKQNRLIDQQSIELVATNQKN